jgi:hypothetical protein
LSGRDFAGAAGEDADQGDVAADRWQADLERSLERIR